MHIADIRRIGTAAAVLLLFHAPARAAVELTRVSATACSLVTDAQFIKRNTAIPFPIESAGTIVDTSARFPAKIYCPVPDYGGIQAESLGWVNVFFLDNSSSANGFAVACVKFHSALGGACSGNFDSGAPPANGPSLIDVHTTNWADNAPAGFAYVYIELPPIGFNRSTLYGLSAGSH